MANKAKEKEEVKPVYYRQQCEVVKHAQVLMEEQAKGDTVNIPEETAEPAAKRSKEIILLKCLFDEGKIQIDFSLCQATSLQKLQHSL